MKRMYSHAELVKLIQELAPVTPIPSIVNDLVTLGVEKDSNFLDVPNLKVTNSMIVPSWAVIESTEDEENLMSIIESIYDQTRIKNNMFDTVDLPTRSTKITLGQISQNLSLCDPICVQLEITTMLNNNIVGSTACSYQLSLWANVPYIFSNSNFYSELYNIGIDGGNISLEMINNVVSIYVNGISFLDFIDRATLRLSIFGRSAFYRYAKNINNVVIFEM